MTVGAFPELVANVGAPLAALAMFLVGILLSYLVRQAQTCASVIKSTGAAFAVYMFQIYVPNGNLMYTVINLALMSALLMFLFAVCRVVGLSVTDPEWRRINASTLPIQ